MRYKDRTIASVADVLSALRQQADSKLLWFRGQSKSHWKLVPSLARTTTHLHAENALIKRFMQNAVPHMDHPAGSEWEWIFLMQHHRAPTRLLDWSESPLAALYFAVTAQPRSEGAVWCLDPVALNIEANIKFDFEAEVPAFGKDNILDSYLPSRVRENVTVLNPIAAVGPRNTARMAAQLGTFTINHRSHTPIERIGRGRHAWRWLIPPSAKKDIAVELSRLGISALSLFPDLDKVADLSREVLP
jgi:hypothetical protein